MGPNNIRNLIPKSCHETLRKSLNLIFQACLNKNTSAETWKTCQLAPIFKADLSCFQPIGLLRCCSKLLEKNIFDAVYNHTNDKQNKHADQLAVLYLNFANAFDTVLHTYSVTEN